MIPFYRSPKIIFLYSQMNGKETAHLGAEQSRHFKQYLVVLSGKQNVYVHVYRCIGYYIVHLSASMWAYYSLVCSKEISIHSSFFFTMENARETELCCFDYD